MGLGILGKENMKVVWVNCRKFMKIKIKRIDKTLPMPEYHTKGAVAFDLYSRIDVVIPAKILERLPTNIIVATPKGYMLEIKDRSSTLKKKGLLIEQFTTCWSEELRDAKLHQKLFRLFGGLGIYPFFMWGPHLVVAARKVKDED